MTDVIASREQVSTRREATRQRLAWAAIRVFARKGVDGASVEEICEEAGFTRGAFYSNFESKNDLCLDVLQRSIDQTYQTLSTQLPRVSASELPIEQKLDRAVSLFLSTVSTDPQTILAINEIRLQAARDPELRPAYRALNESCTPALRDLVADVIAANDVRLGISVDDLLSIMRTLYDQQMIEAIISGNPADHLAVARQMTALLKVLMRV
ncbi:TetR/AcrR family transcriptional regulator [Acidipropionibacterium jensenii]|uniref:Potential acrAB operon repressor n=1 Tax=Acidipropionibacterium jensenii TaxID=1749 RepID=A0A448P024_9ACTN|nr:TetR/AcrR family transcriptional regulator [Acidipropionibacterium jensenii]MDN5976492.1 TetR/AcrR family transcriptional regulator [Acidipropionibacterium jensenii]MDN5995548.1 TetR/AcrR family transcriptional regulator [Acidipropionibacterium jensenii]MDN6021110.1 TetR/AcrR family transcriptional regulator [Acidipropionibacterium jensenii]MDN6425697.1 TetR/AcrR family transcriptional regulator [Acidipropionibacterium jensenii]MDN6441001.1 TetR/AcrR family transcriptional regulator [Acidip